MIMIEANVVDGVVDMSLKITGAAGEIINEATAIMTRLPDALITELSDEGRKAFIETLKQRQADVLKDKASMIKEAQHGLN